MTTTLPAIVCVLYTLTALSYARRGDWAWATVWGGYAVAQVGLIVAGNRSNP